MSKSYPFRDSEILVGAKGRQLYGWADSLNLADDYNWIQSERLATASGDTWAYLPPCNQTLLYAAFVTRTAFATADGSITVGIYGNTATIVAATAIPYSGSAAGDVLALTLLTAALTKGTPMLVTLVDNSSTAGIGWFFAAVQRT
jgi:hypothetical protein